MSPHILTMNNTPCHISALPPAQQTEDYLTGPLSQTPLTRVSGQDPPTFPTPATATQVTHLTRTGLTRIMCPLSHTTSNWDLRGLDFKMDLWN